MLQLDAAVVRLWVKIFLKNSGYSTKYLGANFHKILTKFYRQATKLNAYIFENLTSYGMIVSREKGRQSMKGGVIFEIHH